MLRMCGLKTHSSWNTVTAECCAPVLLDVGHALHGGMQLLRPRRQPRRLRVSEPRPPQRLSNTYIVEFRFRFPEIPLIPTLIPPSIIE